MRPFLLLCFLSLLCTCARAQVTYFPPENEADWETISPASLGYQPDSIAALYDYLEDTQTKGFLLLKDGKIVLEKYFGTFLQDSIWYWASAGKSLRATLIGIAQEEGHLSIQDTTSKYLGTGWTNLDPEQEDRITIWHQLTMTAGLNELFFTCTSPGCLQYLAPAGERWAYHNSPYSLTKDVLEAATGVTLNAYTNSSVENKIGMKTGFWLPLEGNTIFFSRVRDAARFGHLMLAEGRWENTTVLGDTAYLKAMLRPSQALNPAYGYLWWLNGQEEFMQPADRTIYSGPTAPAAPADLVLAAGKNGQFIGVSPSEGLVMVRMGNSGSEDFAPLGYHNSIWERLATLSGVTATRQPRAIPIAAYPNPTSGDVWLRTPKPGRYAYAIFDGRGRRCQVGLTKGRIDLEGLPSGAYWLRLQNGNNVYGTRLVKR